MTERAYLDWNATAPLRPESRAAVLSALDQTGNPSSVHSEGRRARRLIEEARRQVAALVGADPQAVTFTSGATEANALALSPRSRSVAAASSMPERLLVSAIEHPSVRCGGGFAGTAIEEIPVTDAGQVDLAVLAQRLEELAGADVRPLVSIMLANNETGIVQPVAAAADLVHAAGGVLHVDAVQGYGRIPFTLDELRADSVAVSGHKIGGPTGVGALIRAPGAYTPEPLIRGGGQERGLRAGTESTAAIAGFGAAALAAAHAMGSDAVRMAKLRDRLEDGLRRIAPNVAIFGTGIERLPNTTLFAVPGVKAETAVIAFDLEGMALSSGAACSSGKVQSSHVLAAMGVPPALARGAIRVSLGWATTESEVIAFLGAWKRLAEVLIKERQDIAVVAA